MNKTDFKREIKWLIAEKYSGVINDKTEIDIARVKAGEPIAYVIGFINFLGFFMNFRAKTFKKTEAISHIGEDFLISLQPKIHKKD